MAHGISHEFNQIIFLLLSFYVVVLFFVLDGHRLAFFLLEDRVVRANGLHLVRGGLAEVSFSVAPHSLTTVFRILSFEVNN